MVQCNLMFFKNRTIPLILISCILGSSLLGGFTVLPAMADNSSIIFTDSNSTSVSNTPDPTSTTITPNSVALPSNGTLTFSIQTSDTSSSPTTLSGTISFSDNNEGGTFNPTSCTLQSGTCVTTYTAPTNPLNVITINATYSGDSTHLSSSATSQISTSPISTNAIDATTTTVTPSSTTFTPDSPITVTASVADTSNLSSSMIGIMSWSDNGAGGIFSPNVCIVTNNQCALTYTPPANLSRGITITATYAGDTSHSGSSGTSSLSVSSSTPSSTPSTPSTAQPTPSTPSSIPSTSTPSTAQPTPSTPSAQSSESGKTVSPSSNSQKTTAAEISQVVNIPEEIFSKAIAAIESIFQKL
ncbi:MAG: hypothetical protein WBF38_03730 [Nitrosotalea sp.]